MLVLCSDGLSSRRLLAAVRERMAGGKRAALVVTADNVYKKKNYHVPRCTGELESLGLKVELFDVDEQSALALLDYDAVELMGGNPFYLLQALRRSGAEEVLREIAVKNVLIGWSAAAFVLGPSLELVNAYSPEMNTPGLTDLRGLCLTEVEVLPHYDRFFRRFGDFEEICRTYEKANGAAVLRLNDGDGVIIEGESISLLRG